MVFTFNEEYRQSLEYKEWTAAIKRDFPTLPLYLIESAIMAHKANPQAYKTAKDAKDVFKKTPMPTKNNQQMIIEDAIKIEEATIEQPSATITEEVQA